jgi:hypothetical protein
MGLIINDLLVIHAQGTWYVTKKHICKEKEQGKEEPSKCILFC